MTAEGTSSQRQGRSFAMVSLDEMLPHDHALEAYPWLSAQILNRWRRTGAIRAFKGKDGKPVYPKTDIATALNEEMACERIEAPEASSNTGDSGSDRSPDGLDITDTGMMTAAAELREKRSLGVIWKAPRKNSSTSSPPPKSRRKHPARSS